MTFKLHICRDCHCHRRRVFQTGLGIPISLSVIAVAVGRAAGLSMFCVGAPGHFVSKLAPEGTALVYYLDAFEGTIMDRSVLWGGHVWCFSCHVAQL